jgi:NAD(P)-dependent dehydrogenase (short-subunit alcohol dehydrogenase family)
MAQDLAGRRLLITGAASGIGAELARRAHARGARLGLLDLRAEPLAAVAAELPGALTATADVRDRDALTAAVDDLAARLGGLDVAVANAGIATGGPVHLIGPDAFEATIDVNLLGVWRTARAAMPHLIARRGYLLLVSSAAALSPTPYLAAYSASKAGVEAFGRAARVELAHHGVDVGVAYFLFLDTPMVRGGEQQPGFQALKGVVPGPIGRTYPLEPAIEVTLAGIERRARVVAYPRFLRAVLRIRGLLDSRLADLPVRRAASRAEAAFAREAERIGADAAARLPQDRVGSA